ncbi:MAG: hypothetical protein N3A61_09350, partial [Ignavibacteria bacterium]|nr:hypothetical protein [Ignavibacteria bacterium]
VISLSNQPIVFSIGSFAIREFLSPKVPDSISYKGEIVINPNYKTIEINLPNVISYSYQFNMYSIFRIDNVDRTDTSEIWSDKDWNSKDKKEFDKRIENASEMELTMEIDNGLPIGFSLTGFLADTSYKKLFAITRQEGTGSSSDSVMTILPANIDSEGKVSSSVFQTKKIKLTRDEILKIKNAKYLILKGIVSTSNGRKVYFRANDYIKLKAYGTFKVKFDSESFKD